MRKYTLLKIGIDRIIARIRIMATAYTNPDNIIGEEITTENSDNTFHHTIISLLPLPVRLVFRLESWRLIHWVELTKKNVAQTGLSCDKNGQRSLPTPNMSFFDTLIDVC